MTVKTSAKTSRQMRRRIRAEHIFALGFLVIILVGAGLLMLPAASNEGTITPFSDTLFTAVSATCVTGLVVVDTGIHWSLFGQSVILCMIQIGGLGFMSFALILLGALGKRVSPRVRNLTAQSFGLDTGADIRRLVRRVFVGTAVIEGCGALLLMIRTIPIFGIGRGIFAGIFLAVSAFCNAGFDPFGGVLTSPFSSLVEFGPDPLLLCVLSALIVLGAAGFLVWSDLWDRFRYRKRMSVYTRFVLAVTGCLLIGGAVLIALLEWNNPATIGTMTVPQKLLHAFFQSVTPRTAGFDAIGQTAMRDASKVISMVLMFVGGASGSTAGGAKVSTVGVMLLAVWATLRGKREIRVMKREIPADVVFRAMCILFILLVAIFSCAIAIVMLDGVPMEAALYECFSAFCTVGLSLSLTPTLGIVSKMLLIFAMYAGRVGILTLSSVLLHRSDEEDAVRYPTVKLLIG